MKIISKEGINKEEILGGVVFIYPTDTIYGVGCDATNDNSVKRVREIKLRDEKPFSVIAPSKDWIKENCVVGPELDKLPGAYTLILKLKNKSCISKFVNNGLDTLGVRIPKHWISNLVSELGIPIVTTSANKSGEKFMTCLEDLDIGVDFVIDEGKLNGKPSTIIKDGKEIKR
jgi:L-threonylcarbamoyladenylate synthase